MTTFLTTVDACVERIRAHAGAALRLATPLGLGKPNVLLNAIYSSAQNDPSLQLDVYTALSLARPRAKNDLEHRFLGPFLDRHFGKNYPDLAWVAAQHANALPPNVRVHEFYMQSGAMLNVESAQREYASLNYTHVARDLAEIGINVVVQLIAVREDARGAHYSLACNPDVSLDLLERIVATGAAKPLVVGVVHPNLPYVGNEAEVDVEVFDIVLRDDCCAHTLFALPREPVDTAEYALGLHASALVRDGGTLQIGIGALSDALVHALRLRQQRNDDYRSALTALGGADQPLIQRIGGVEPFTRGLYGASEMVMDGFMHLVKAGILKRRVYDDLGIERALAQGHAVNVSSRRDGRYLRGAFYLGSKDFYTWLRELGGEAFEGLSMTRVSDINQLYGGRETLDALQRRDARFFNTCMMATALGAATSDALDSGQVVSGVGGQYNFVAMAHALDGGRSVLMLRSTRSKHGAVAPSILWNYGHTTIPRHLRDIFVTEYGTADLRGKSDEDCILAMLAITDARFIDALTAQAKANAKLRRDFVIPDRWRHNTPARLAEALAPLRACFPQFPFGSDFSAEELALLPALQRLQGISTSKLKLAAFLLSSIWKGRPTPEDARLLQRLGLEAPHGVRERVLQRLVVRALRNF